MSFSLISLSSSSLSSPLRKFPPFFSFSERSSPSSTLYPFSPPSSTTSILNSSIFNRTTIHPPPPTCFLPIYSYSNFSSMSSGTGATPAHAFADDSTPSTSATDDLGVSDSDDDDAPQDHQTHHNHSSSSLPERWHVLGLGQAMVDFSGMVDDEFLGRLGLEKGTRKVVNHEERGRVLRAMDGCSYKAAAGGSLSNTLVALARLGGQPIGGPSLNVAIAGSVGSDPLGGFYR